MGFTFNGKTSMSMGLPTRMEIENRIPDIRNLTDKIAGRHGVFDFGETLSERKIGISCFIPPGKTDTQLLKLKDTIVDWLNPDRGICPLILDSEPGRVYYARLEDGFSFDRLVRNTATFDLSFFCPDPFAYAITDEIFILTESTTIKRELGNVVSQPLYEVRGILKDSSQKISFTVNGEKLEIKGPLAENEVMYINTDLMTAKIVDGRGQERNALSHMVYFTFPYLNVGENTISFGADGGICTSFVIHAKSRWL